MTDTTVMPPDPFCTEVQLDPHGAPRTCIRLADHTGDHMDDHGRTWEPPARSLGRLEAKWGRTHTISWTGTVWKAVDKDPTSRWKSEVEFSPEALEMALRHHHGPPPGSAPRTSHHTTTHHTQKGPT